MSIAPDVEAVQIAAGLFGAVTLGTFVFLLMQIVKGFAPALNGQAAEVVVIIVSLIAVVVALVSADADWYASDTWVSLIAGTLSTTVVARGVYSQLFKASPKRRPVRATAPAKPAPVKAATK